VKDERFFWGDLHPVCVLRGLLYNLWVLILAVLTAWLCVEGYHLFTYHPVYTASATVAVNVKGGTSAYTSLDLTARMAQVFASVFQSDTFREAAQCDVVASVLPETNLINVQVTAENPRESFLSLKNVLENHADLTDELFWDTIADLKFKLIECHDVYGIWGTFVASWYPWFYTMHRFKLGRLQYEAVHFSGDTPVTGRRLHGKAR